MHAEQQERKGAIKANTVRSAIIDVCSKTADCQHPFLQKIFPTSARTMRLIARIRYMFAPPPQGYFLLRHLSELVGVARFDDLLRVYIMQYQGQLVTSQEVFKLLFDNCPLLK